MIKKPNFQAWLQQKVSDDSEVILAGKLEYLRLYLTDAMREIRNKAGLTQTQLAEKLGVQQAAVSKLESALKEHELESVLHYLHALGADLLVAIKQGDELYQASENEGVLLVDVPDVVAQKALALNMSVREYVRVAVEKFSREDDGLRTALVKLLESDDSVAVKVRERLGSRTIQEVAVELEKCLSLSEEDRIFAVKNVLAANVACGESNRGTSDEIEEIELLDLTEEVLEKLTYIDFLLQILLKTSQSSADKKTVYPLLQDNLDKLDLNFADLLRHWSKNYFAGESLYKVQTVAGTISNFGTLIGQFPQGNLANNLDIAIVCFEVIEIIFTREEYPIEWAISKLNLGNAYGNRIYGDHTENREKAIVAYQDALKIYSREEYPIEWAETQTNSILLYSAKIKNIKRDDNSYVKLLDKLVSICNAVLEIFTQDSFTEKWVIIKNNLASIYCDTPHPNRSDNLELAIEIYNEVLGVLNQESLPQEWANTQLNMGIAYDKRLQGDRQENFNLAVQAYQNSLKVYTRENYPFTYAILQNNLGNAYRDQGLATSAINYYWLALEIHTHTAYPNESLRASRNLGNTAFKSGDWDEAIKGYSIAIKSVETSRSWVKSESRRQKILEQSIGIYESMVQACINAGQIEKAFEYSERSRSKRLVDLMASYNLSQGEEIPPKVQELLQQYEELQQQIDKERQSHKSENNRSETRAAWEAYNEAIASLETQKQQVWENLRREDRVLAGEIQVNPLSLSEIQKLIDQPNTAILSFYTTNSDTHIFVVQKNKITLHTCIGQGLDMLQSWINQNWLLPYMNDSKKWETQINGILRELAERLQISELIFKHLERIEELILVPHLLLHQIPFAALPTGEYQEYLGDKFLIRYTPSCQILEFCQQRDTVGTFNEISLQYGTVEDAEDNLPYARFEGGKLAQMYNIPPANRLIGSSQATCENYRQLAQQVQVLHSCHHAQSRLDNPLESQLKLAHGSSITLGQLMTPSWRFPQLVEVFLSCCETNLGTPSLTDDILTLSTGFLCAGARSVVSTLWSVNDLATALFSIFYYQQRQEGKNRPEALQKAQIQLREFTKVDLNKIFPEVEIREKELIGNRKKYTLGSLEHKQWEYEYNMYAKLNRQIKGIENSPQQFPFSDPVFWAAFICQGLR